MITPEFWDYELDILQTNRDLQESILRDIVRRVLKADLSVTDTAAWQAEKIQGAGMVYEDLIGEITKAAGATEQEIKSIFSDVQAEVFNYDDELVIKAGYKPAEIKKLSPAMARIWNAALKKTCTEAKNLTKTTAITSQSLYIQACDLAHMQITSGAFSYQDAIRSAVKSAARQGITVVYDSGWVSSLDVAIRRSVLTGVNQTAGQLQLMRAQELDHDIMETTAHMGARWEHAMWQGKLVSLSGKPGYLTLADIGYGDVRGFMGANCRHNWYPFWPGISTPAYTPEQLEEFRIAKVTYNGEDIPIADAIQKQRGYERSIRAKKRELVMLDEAMKNGQDMQESFLQTSAQLKNRENKLKDFCRQTGLRRDRSREQIFAVKTENAVRGFDRSVAQKAVWADKKAVDILGRSDIMKMKGVQTVNSGGITGALNPNSERAMLHAERYYSEVRKMNTDCESIAKNVGWTKESISKIKDHLFYRKHNLGGTEPEHFDADYDIAITWQNLIEGKNIQEKDIVLLKHEYLELHIMKNKNISYAEAHKLAEKKHNYSAALKEWRNNI